MLFQMKKWTKHYLLKSYRVFKNMIKILLDLNIPLLYPLKILLRNHNSSFEKSKNILFFTRNLGLGDSVLLLPLVKKLKGKCPQL